MSIAIPFSPYRVYLLRWGRLVTITREYRVTPTLYRARYVWASGWGRIGPDRWL